MTGARIQYEAPVNEREMMELITFREIPAWLPDVPGISLNLGPGMKGINGATELELPHWDADREQIPYRNGTVSNIYAIHFLEHVAHPIAVLRECQRVLRPGGHLNVGLPYYSAQCNAMDLDHKSQWCEETWRNLFDNPHYDKNHGDWKFRIGFNMIFGLVERNIMLMTQLIRED